MIASLYMLWNLQYAVRKGANSDNLILWKDGAKIMGGYGTETAFKWKTTLTRLNKPLFWEVKPNMVMPEAFVIIDPCTGRLECRYSKWAWLQCCFCVVGPETSDTHKVPSILQSYCGGKLNLSVNYGKLHWSTAFSPTGESSDLLSTAWPSEYNWETLSCDVWTQTIVGVSA